MKTTELELINTERIIILLLQIENSKKSKLRELHYCYLRNTLGVELSYNLTQ